MFKLLIVDDEILIRKGLSETIDWASIDVQIVGEATNGVEGLEMVASLKPDIIISDIRMPIMDGIAMAKELQNNNFDGIVIILSGYSEFTYAQQAITSDIVAYMLKPTDNEMLLKTVVESSRKLATRRAKNRIIKMYQDDAVLLKGKTLNDFLNATLSAAEIADRFSLYGLKP
ncbi:MAG: response regulator, partial [Christensenellaceae bacterium]|nr:response regulator [Christensenellaceae bacterium]